jgi:hypothetical protein
MARKCKNIVTHLIKEVFRHLLKYITETGSTHVTVNCDAPRLESLGNRFRGTSDISDKIVARHLLTV